MSKTHVAPVGSSIRKTNASQCEGVIFFVKLKIAITEFYSALTLQLPSLINSGVLISQHISDNHQYNEQRDSVGNSD